MDFTRFAILQRLKPSIPGIVVLQSLKTQSQALIEESSFTCDERTRKDS